MFALRPPLHHPRRRLMLPATLPRERPQLAARFRASRGEASIEMILVHCPLHRKNYIIYMVKIELTIIDLIFTMVHVHQAKSMWLRHCARPVLEPRDAQRRRVQ